MGCAGLGQHGLCGTGTAWAMWVRDRDVMDCAGLYGTGTARTVWDCNGLRQHGLCETVWD